MCLTTTTTIPPSGIASKLQSCYLLVRSCAAHSAARAAIVGYSMYSTRLLTSSPQLSKYKYEYIYKQIQYKYEYEYKCNYAMVAKMSSNKVELV